MSGAGYPHGSTRSSTDLPEIRFAVIFIGGEKEMYGPAQYQFPPNVTHVETHYLLHRSQALSRIAARAIARLFRKWMSCTRTMRQSGEMAGEKMIDAFSRLGRQRWHQSGGFSV